MPILVFGERGGTDIGGDHKDTMLGTNVLNDAFGGDVDIACVDAVAGRRPLLRFSLTGHIPTNAIVNSAILSVRTRFTGAAGNVTAHRLLRAWGITPTNEGASQSPAALGQATFARSFDFNGAGGDVTWAAGNYSAADYGAAEATVAIAGVGYFDFSIPVMVQNWINNDVTNYGLALIPAAGVRTLFQSQETANVNERPYLTIDYTVPEAANTNKSRTSISLSMGI